MNPLSGVGWSPTGVIHRKLGGYRHPRPRRGETINLNRFNSQLNWYRLEVGVFRKWNLVDATDLARSGKRAFCRSLLLSLKDLRTINTSCHNRLIAIFVFKVQTEGRLRFLTHTFLRHAGSLGFDGSRFAGTGSAINAFRCGRNAGTHRYIPSITRPASRQEDTGNDRCNKHLLSHAHNSLDLDP